MIVLEPLDQKQILGYRGTRLMSNLHNRSQIDQGIPGLRAGNLKLSKISLDLLFPVAGLFADLYRGTRLMSNLHNRSQIDQGIPGLRAGNLKLSKISLDLLFPVAGLFADQPIVDGFLPLQGEVTVESVCRDRRLELRFQGS